MAVTVQCLVHPAVAAATRSCHLSAAGSTWHQSVTTCAHAHWHGHLYAGYARGRLHRETQDGHLLEQRNKSYSLADNRYGTLQCALDLPDTSAQH